MSEAPVEFMSTKHCPECGKAFSVLWPSQWAYKRGNQKHHFYLCSYTCLRAYDKKEGRPKMGTPAKLTKEQKQRAVQIALEGGDPKPFLAECGSKAPDVMWYSIKQDLMGSDPETFDKLPKIIRAKKAKEPEKKPEKKPEISAAEAMDNMQDAADKFFGTCSDMGLRIAETEEPKITKPVCYDGMTIREVEGVYGRYRYASTASAEYIDFENTDKMDTLSLTIEQWRKFRKEQEKAAVILGVEL